MVKTSCTYLRYRDGRFHGIDGVSCFVYANLSDYDSSYREFLKATRPRVDLSIGPHRLALLKWLNVWGCRQFAIKYHDVASSEIEDWNKKHINYLFSIDKALMSLDKDDIKTIKKAYSDLVSRTASRRKLKNKMATVEFGPTGAAKILFALRPKMFVPWDQPIRTRFELDGTAESYCDYLLAVRKQLEDLSEECERNGFGLNDLANVLGRDGSSLTKLIDEYYWVTVTKECKPPKEKDFKLWVSWL